MKFISVYRIPDTDDKGYASKEEYIHVNSAGFYEFDEPFGATHRKNGRKDFYLSYNHTGSMKIRSNGNENEIGGGYIVIFKPFEEQYYGQANKKPIASYWVHFTGYGADDLLEKASLGSENVYFTGIDIAISSLFEALIKEIDEKRSFYESVSALLLEQIVYQIARKTGSGLSDMETAHPGVRRSVGYIQRNFQTNINVTGLATIAGLSPSRYTALFKSAMTVSPQRYLTDFRLQKAKELLLHTNLSVKQVSGLVGFQDQLYFSRLFKKYTKSSPKNYKQAINQGERA